MDPSPALFTPSLKFFTQVIYKMRSVCVCAGWVLVNVRAAVHISVFTRGFGLFMHLHTSVYVGRCACTCACACEQLHTCSSA